MSDDLIARARAALERVGDEALNKLITEYEQRRDNHKQTGCGMSNVFFCERLIGDHVAVIESTERAHLPALVGALKQLHSHYNGDRRLPTKFDAGWTEPMRRNEELLSKYGPLTERLEDTQ